MKNQLKLLSLAAALCGAVACSSGGDSGTTGGPGTTGSSSGGATGSGPTGGSPTGTGGGATGTGGSSTGGSSTGAPGPTTYPCVDGGPAYQPTNPPDSLPTCWCNPTKASGPLAYYQIINSCPPPGSSPDLSIPLPGSENIAGLAAALLPLLPDAGPPGFVPAGN
jgi:hypothetical protein